MAFSMEKNLGNCKWSWTPHAKRHKYKRNSTDGFCGIILARALHSLLLRNVREVSALACGYRNAPECSKYTHRITVDSKPRTDKRFYRRKVEKLYLRKAVFSILGTCLKCRPSIIIIIFLPPIKNICALGKSSCSEHTYDIAILVIFEGPDWQYSNLSNSAGTIALYVHSLQTC